MKNSCKALIPLLLSTGLLATAIDGHARIKCWKNDEGVRECGDKVPPEFSQKEHEELSDQGITVNRTERARTPEEIEAERAERERQAEIARQEAERAKHDRMLLDTFSNIDDMVMARDGKIVAIRSRIKLAESQLVKLRKNLDEQISRAAAMERRGQAPSPELLANIESARKQIRDNLDYTREQQKQIDAIMAVFDADIARFKELKGLE